MQVRRGGLKTIEGEALKGFMSVPLDFFLLT